MKKAVHVFALCCIGLWSYSAAANNCLDKQRRKKHKIEFYNGALVDAFVSCPWDTKSKTIRAARKKICCDYVRFSASSFNGRTIYGQDHCDRETERTKIHLKGTLFRVRYDITCENR